MELLLAHRDCSVNQVTDTGKAPLHIACQNGQASAVQILLAHPDIRVNVGDRKGATPLHLAAQEGHAPCVNLLRARKKIKVNAVPASGWPTITALFIASQQGHTECVQYLLERDDIEIGTANTVTGVTALVMAFTQGHAQVARKLVAHAAREEVRRLASSVLSSLPAEVLKDLPDLAARAAALRLPLFAAAALGETEDERAAGIMLAYRADELRASDIRLAALAASDPSTRFTFDEVPGGPFGKLATPGSQAVALALQARGRLADAAAAAATTSAALLAAQGEQTQLFEAQNASVIGHVSSGVTKEGHRKT